MDIDQTVHIYVIRKPKDKFFMAQFLLQPQKQLLSNQCLSNNVCSFIY